MTKRPNVKRRIVNESDKTLIIPPNESVDVMIQKEGDTRTLIKTKIQEIVGFK
ncbi:hypothetical protein [Methanohalobium sp.]|uniref:hypothetical protein n=1 Tax=Methanohalobium sp. TaxID=2837493 RepID=UPI0025F8C17A|nr:hypothetical protein [Methanohalobium sp.]